MIKVLKKIMKETRAQLQKTYEDRDKKASYSYNQPKE